MVSMKCWLLIGQLPVRKLPYMAERENRNPIHLALPFLERSLFRSGDHGMDPLFGAFLGSTASKNVSIVFLTDEDMLTKMMC